VIRARQFFARRGDGFARRAAHPRSAVVTDASSIACEDRAANVDLNVYLDVA